jgi:RNA polymerase sigma-70 factor, ECF subfamily
MPEEPLRLWEAWRTRGDARAFEDLVRPELGRAVALARSEGCPPGEAEDAVQESLVRLACEKSETPAHVGVRGWFFGIVRDRARSRLRADRRRRSRELLAAIPEVVPGGTPQLDFREEVDRALSGLPEEERGAVRLRYLLDLEYREVAYVLGVSEGACRMRVLRALKRVRGTLGTGAGAALAAVVFPVPARASSLISSAVASAPGTTAATIGGTVLMTMTQKVLLGSTLAGLLGAALGAGVALQVDSSNRNLEHEQEGQEIARLRKGLADAKAEKDDAIARAETLRREKAVVAEERDRALAGLGSGGPAKSGGSDAASVTAKAATAAAPAPGPAPVDPAGDLQKRAGELCKGWVADAVQIRDEAKRNEAIAAIREALSSGDPVQILAGLYAVQGISNVPYDKAAMRPLVIAQLEAQDPLFRRAALNDILATSPRPDPANVDLLLRLKDDPSSLVRRDLAPAISWAARGDLTGEAGAVVLRAMQDIEAEEAGAPPKGGKTEFIRQLGGRMYFRLMSPEIEAKILALVKNPATQESALHFFFQNMEKTSNVVDVLFEIAEGGGPNSAGATRALTYEVPADQAPRVAAFLMKVLESGPAYQQQQVLFGLRNFGTEAELPALDRLAANELLDASSRKVIGEAAEFIRRRLKR